MIHVDGRLAGEGAAQLDEACGGRRHGLVLDLQNLVTIDDNGVATLRRLAGDGIELSNVSPYMALLLGTIRGGGSSTRPGPIPRKGAR